ncbi:MAG: prolipoprotein diacylglyceryl transferase [Acidobacteriota bacterium]
MHPLLFDFGFWKIGSYGFMAVITIIITLYLLKFLAIREKLDYGKLVEFYFFAGISGLIGSKLFHLMISYRQIFNNPRVIWIIFISGGVWYGGLLAAFFVGVSYARYRGLPVLTLMDIYAPLIMLGLGICRLGCFLSGCCYGKPGDVPWAVTFTNALAHRIHPDLPYVPIHPTQIYEALGCFAIAIILALMYRRKKFDGQIGISLFILYGIVRSYIEMYRGDFRGSLFGEALSTSQFLGILTAIIATGAYIYFWKKSGSKKSV